MPHLTLTDIVHFAPQFIVINALRQAVENVRSLHAEQLILPLPLDKRTQDNTTYSTPDIPLSRVRDDTQIHYVSAIALKLSARWSVPAPDIAAWLCGSTCSYQEGMRMCASQEESFPQYARHLSARLLPHLKVERSSLDWLHVRITMPGIAAWLTFVLERINQSSGVKTTSQRQCANTLPGNLHNSPELFSAQHAIARCYSLLYRATLAETDIQPYGYSPQNISILGETLQNSARICATVLHGVTCASPADCQLVHALVDIVDAVSVLHPSSTANSKQYLSLAFTLGQAFHKFHAHSRIHTAEWSVNPEQVKFRLGLIHLCAEVLRSLLEDGVGITACQHF